MYNLILISELAICTGAGLTALYHNLKSLAPAESYRFFPNNGTEKLLRLQSHFGYNPHSLVGISEEAQTWFDFQTQCGLSFTEHGKIRLVSGEIIGAEEDLPLAVSRFVEESKAVKKLVAFAPTTERFARLVAPLGFEVIKVGASPYFNLQTWNPRGNKAKKMRAGTNQARKAGVSVEPVVKRDLSFCTEVYDLSENWLKNRRTAVKFGWLFDLNPFRYAEHKKYFAARNEEGKLVGVLAASPIPARRGWYLEDVLRDVDAPNGTADLLVFEALKTLAAEGAELATLGTVPLTADGEDSLVNRKHPLTKGFLTFSRENLDSFYNFKGLRLFKNKFVPDWWESEYVLFPKGLFVPPRVANCLVKAVLPDGIMSMLLKQFIR